MLRRDVKKWGIPSKFLRISPLYVYELVQLYKQKPAQTAKASSDEWDGQLDQIWFSVIIHICTLFD